MSKPNVFETDLLKLIFQNVDITTIGDAGGLRGSAGAGSLYCSLHSAYPGEAGDQSSSELAYTGYARIAVARSAGGWAVSGNVVNPVANVDFGECTAAGGVSAMFWGIGAASAGGGKLLYTAAIGSGAYECTGKASSDAVTIPGLTLIVDDRVVFWAAGESALPAGITQGTVYFVKTVSGNDYTLAATSGGATIDITVDGAAMAQKITPLAVNVGTIPRIKTTSAIKEE